MNSKVLVFALLVLAGWMMPAMAGDDQASSDAAWTIYCRSFAGETRAAEAKLAREQLLRSTGMKQWYVINQENETTLFYGHYRSTDLQAEDSKDRKDAQRAHDDLKQLRSMEDANKNKVFTMLLFVETPQPGVDGPPEWDLKKAAKDMRWTVYIGIYNGTPERRRAAVQAVKALRDAGKPAYYYHDSNASLVCIGAWPEGAVRPPDEAIAPADEPDAEIFAYGVPLPANTPREAKTSGGKKALIFSSTAQILDPGLQMTCNLNPDFMTNGVVMGREVTDRKTGKKQVIPNHSQLLRIPGRDGSVSTPEDNQQKANEVQRQLPTNRPPKGTGTLNKLQDKD